MVVGGTPMSIPRRATAIHGRRRRACVVAAAGLVGLCTSVAGLTGGVERRVSGSERVDRVEAATSNNLQDKEIWVTHQSPAGWTRHRLTTDPPDRRAADQFPSVNPKGREVAYASNRNWPEFPNVELDSEIYVMDIHDDDGDGYGDHLRRLTDNAVSDLDPNWSPDGKRIVWNSNAADPTKNVPLDLYVMSADGEGPTIKLPRDPAATTTQHAEVSPDGQWVVFVSGYGAMRAIDFDLFMTHADGSGPVIRLTNTPTIGETHPDFAPDGTRLVFVATEDLDGDGVADTDLDLYVMAAAPRSDDERAGRHHQRHDRHLDRNRNERAVAELVTGLHADRDVGRTWQRAEPGATTRAVARRSVRWGGPGTHQRPDSHSGRLSSRLGTGTTTRQPGSRASQLPPVSA